jgi:ABC-type glycerol-3-phosphate transport system permease component
MRTFRADLPKHVILIILVILTYYPLFFIFVNSLKDNAQFVQNPYTFSLPFHFDNYTIAWPQIDHFILNSIVVAGVSLVVTLLCAAMAAYVLGRFSFRGRELIFLLYVALLLIPGALTIIPLYLEMKTLNLIDNWLALVFPYVAGGQVLAVFVLRAFFAALPRELFEAARLDGASEFQILSRIVIPLSLPPMGAIAIITTLNVWGDYLWPTIVLPTASKYTMSAGVGYFTAQFGLVQQTGQVFAVYVMASLPIIILIVVTMRTYVSGLTSGALKL